MRFLLAALLGLALATASAAGFGLLPLTAASEPAAPPPPAPTPAPVPPAPASAPVSAPRPEPSPPHVSAFRASPGDVAGHVKETAARFVAEVGTWRPSAPDDPAGRVVAAGYPADLARVAGPLLDTPADAASTTVVYAQYGGLTEASASVMVLACQQLRGEVGEDVREVLLDVRLRRTVDGWQVTPRVDPPRPPVAPARPGGPTALGRAVLDNPRIRIPEPGTADILQRRVGDPILAVLDELGRTHDLDVHVLVTGHPGTVFPTTRVSNHAVGRAVDVRALDGRLVVAIPRDDPLLAAVLAAAGRAGATEVGGPVRPPGGGFFTDDVHRDHLHLGITPGKPPAGAPS